VTLPWQINLLPHASYILKNKVYCSDFSEVVLISHNPVFLSHELTNMVKHSLSYTKNVKESGEKILFNEKSLKVRFVHFAVRSTYLVNHGRTNILVETKVFGRFKNLLPKRS
jgi:hypothetical protein